MMTSEPWREELLQRIQERTDALLEEVACSIQEALERYVRDYEPPRPPLTERRRRPREG